MQRRDDHDGYDHPEEPHPRSREGTTPVIPLVRMAAAIDDDPTLEQIDELLTELRRMPRDHRVVALIDDLLDYRMHLAA